MELGLADRAAIVTAASKGLGRGTALALATAGCHLVLNARDATALKATADECREHGVDVIEMPGDATVPETPAALVDRAVSAFARLDIAVANAGGPPPGKALEVDDDMIRTAVEHNLIASARLVREAVPAMKETGFGRIVCITSTSVKQPISGLSLSNTARTGLYAWCKTAATDLAADPATKNITINLACPGLHDTDRVRQLYGGDAPAGIGDAEDFGRVVAFLSSTSARFITGQAILVDGGATLGL
ncbi:MAG: 3-oxoacyl-[acyl-carrier protein] reductase [Actinomycetota bacterium]|jgi:3-oxoacyl-[acyl-carrier protein] reductase